MVDARPRASGAPMPDPNATRVAAKRARFAAIKKNLATPRVRVLPANDELRRVLHHPRGMRFRASGSVEWRMYASPIFDASVRSGRCRATSLRESTSVPVTFSSPSSWAPRS